jgi:hypothetical protein
MFEDVASKTPNSLMDASEAYYRFGQPKNSTAVKSSSSIKKYQDFFKKETESPDKSVISYQSERKMLVDSRQTNTSKDSDAY